MGQAEQNLEVDFGHHSSAASGGSTGSQGLDRKHKIYYISLPLLGGIGSHDIYRWGHVELQPF